MFPFVERRMPQTAGCGGHPINSSWAQRDQTIYALLIRRVIPTKITAPTNATMIEPIMPPPGQMPKTPKSQPPRIPPRIPRMMSTRTPYPPPFITLPASHPAINPTRIHSIKFNVRLFPTKGESARYTFYSASLLYQFLNRGCRERTAAPPSIAGIHRATSWNCSLAETSTYSDSAREFAHCVPPEGWFSGTWHRNTMAPLFPQHWTASA